MSARDLAATVREHILAEASTFASVADVLDALAALEKQAADAQAKYDRDMDEAVEAIRRHYLARVRAEETLAYVRAELQNALDAFNASCRETDKFEARAVSAEETLRQIDKLGPTRGVRSLTGQMADIAREALAAAGADTP